MGYEQLMAFLKTSKSLNEQKLHNSSIVRWWKWMEIAGKIGQFCCFFVFVAWCALDHFYPFLFFCTREWQFYLNYVSKDNNMQMEVEKYKKMQLYVKIRQKKSVLFKKSKKKCSVNNWPFFKYTRGDDDGCIRLRWW